MIEQNAIKLLDKIDWDFKGYSIAASPNDINYLHWYPAPFIPQIPSIMIQLFSQEDQIVLDPFCGSGVTLIEAAKQKRKFIGVDNNPISIDIAKAKFEAIQYATAKWKKDLSSLIESENRIRNIYKYCEENNIDIEVKKWFEENTLKELLHIHNIIKKRDHNKNFLLELVIFSSILYKVTSQREHYTYITDRCFPKELRYYPAIDIFLDKMDIISKASSLFRNQFNVMHNNDTFSYKGDIRLANAQQLNWIKDNKVDLIITSPPYLGVHDYNKSMRLTNYFFYKFNLTDFINNEIGSRSKRKRINAFDNYIKDMKTCFIEFNRVLKNKGYFILIIGQGKGKVVKSDIVEIVNDFLRNDLNLKLIFKQSRQVMYRRIQTPGTSNEYIEIYKKT